MNNLEATNNMCPSFSFPSKSIFRELLGTMEWDGDDEIILR